MRLTPWCNCSLAARFGCLKGLKGVLEAQAHPFKLIDALKHLAMPCILPRRIVGPSLRPQREQTPFKGIAGRLCSTAKNHDPTAACACMTDESFAAQKLCQKIWHNASMKEMCERQRFANKLKLKWCYGSAMVSCSALGYAMVIIFLIFLVPACEGNVASQAASACLGAACPILLNSYCSDSLRLIPKKSARTPAQPSIPYRGLFATHDGFFNALRPPNSSGLAPFWPRRSTATREVHARLTIAVLHRLPKCWHA